MLSRLYQLGPSFGTSHFDLLRDETSGSSADLVLALKTLSLWFERPLQQIVAATGELGLNGELHKVHFTDEKLHGLASEFPGLPVKVLVPTGTSLPESLPAHVEVIEVKIFMKRPSISSLTLRLPQSPPMKGFWRSFRCI